MPKFFTMLAKHYDPGNVDQGMFSMFAVTPHAVPLIATSEVDPNSGTVTVDGKPVSKGKCIKFDFSPLPFYFVPVGEVAREFGKTYTVKLTGFRNKKGKKFAPCTFRLTTDERGTDDGRHKENESVAKEVSDEGIVLLKNDGTLPIAVGERVALLAPIRISASLPSVRRSSSRVGSCRSKKRSKGRDFPSRKARKRRSMSSPAARVKIRTISPLPGSITSPKGKKRSSRRR